MSSPDTPAGRQLLRLHPELGAEAVIEIERQAGGRQVQADILRRQRVADQLHHLLTREQSVAVAAVLSLDADAIAGLGDDQLRLVLDGLASMPDQDPEGPGAAREAAARYLDEIM